MQGARPGRHGACEIRGAMGLEMPLIDYFALRRTAPPQPRDMNRKHQAPHSPGCLGLCFRFSPSPFLPRRRRGGCCLARAGRRAKHGKEPT